MADRFTRIRANQFLNRDLRPEDIKSVNEPVDKSSLTYDSTSQLFKWQNFSWNVSLEDDTLESTSSISYVIKLVLDEIVPETGRYLLLSSAEVAVLSFFGWGNSGVGKVIVAREVDLSYDIFNVHNVKQNKFEVFTAFKVLDLTAGENIKIILAYSSGNITSTTYIQRARLVLKRVG